MNVAPPRLVEISPLLLGGDCGSGCRGADQPQRWDRLVRWCARRDNGVAGPSPPPLARVGLLKRLDEAELPSLRQAGKMNLLLLPEVY